VVEASQPSGDGLTRRVARRVRPWLARLHKPEHVWQRGLDGEIDHWRKYLTTQGDEWPDEYRTRLDPHTPLAAELTALIDVPADALVRILDVGAGPLTILGKVWNGHHVDVTAVDALAARYDELLAENAIEPPVRTRKCDTEHLDELFAPDTFDLVHARNTVDHGYDPERALRQMAAVTAPGGVIVLAHHRDVAALEAYEGLHQWNLRIDGPTYVAWRPGERRDLVAALGSGFTLEQAEPRPDGWELVVIRKSPPPR
jgi:SAM-dependent methyltransferase